ncbi:hypothetical protein Tco_1282307 [Tanacetum coccineum]
MSIQDMEDLKQQYLDEMRTLINGKDYRNGNIDIEIKINKLKENFNEMSIEIRKKGKEQLEQVANLSTYPSLHFNSFCYDDDDDEEYNIAITPEKPVDSLIMENEHLDTIPETKSDEFIKSSVENLVQTQSESEDECECDVPDCDDSQTTNFSTFSNPLFDDSTSSDEHEFNLIHNEDLDSTPKDVRFNVESYLLESLVNRDTLMASPSKIDFLLDEFVGELTRLQSIPPGIDNINLDPEVMISLEVDEILTSLPSSNHFHVDYPDLGDSTIDVVEDIPVDVPNILAPHPTLHMDFDFIPSNDLGSDLDDSSPSEDRNKIYDPGICIEVESMRFLSTLSPVIDTLLPFSSENEVKVFNHGVHAYKEKSPPSSSHRGFKAFQLISENLMLIHGDNTPNLGVCHPHFYPP